MKAGPITTERDLDILSGLLRFRYLTVSQIQLLYFPSARTAYRRLQALRGLEHVAAFQVPRISDAIYELTKSGALCLAGDKGLQEKELGFVRRRKPSDDYFLRHLLGINDVLIAFDRACEKAAIEIVEVIPDYLGTVDAKGHPQKRGRDRAPAPDGQKEKLVHTPDSVIILRKEERYALLFLEIDRGTEDLSNPEKGFLKAMRFYLGYYQSGGYKRYERDAINFKSFRVLVVTSSPTRLSNMRDRVTYNIDAAAKLKQALLWGAGADSISAESILNRVWVPLLAGDTKMYAIA